MANGIVKYNNWMNTLRFSRFNAVDYNLFMGICSQMREQGTSEVILGFPEIREITGYTRTSNVQLASDLKNMSRKLLDIQCDFAQENDSYVIFSLFSYFRISLKDETLTAAVNEKFLFILNELTKNFTRLEMEEFVGLESKHAKTLYRLLMQFRSTGVLYVSLEHFRKWFDLSDGLSVKYIKRDIIQPSVDILNGKKLFRGLAFETEHENKRGRPVKGYRFTFDNSRFLEQIAGGAGLPGGAG